MSAKEAAERIVTRKDLIADHTVASCCVVAREDWRLAVSVARAYLAEHPADDGEAVTEEKASWMDGVKSVHPWPDGFIVELSRPNPFLQGRTFFVPNGTTVCQLRRLLDALGVTE